MYKLKQKPEDFIVEEIPKLELGEGSFSYFLLEKKNWTTNDAVKKIAEKLNIREKYINVAGNKDKDAITRQYISIYKVNPERIVNLRIMDIKLKFVGLGKERFRLGQLKGNKFKITVRNLDSKKDLKIKFIENYYDEQRFGMKNAEIGYALLKKDFAKACSLAGLKVYGNDYIGALRKKGKRVLRFYVNSYQSLLFNKTVSVYLRSLYRKYSVVKTSYGDLIFSDENAENEKVPVVGFLTELNSKFKDIYERILKDEGISLQDFLIKSFPEISSEGVERDLVKNVYGFKYKYEKDEMNKKKFKAVLEFTLEPGSYATLVVKKLFH